MALILAIDVGGTNLRAAAVETTKLRVAWRAQASTDEFSTFIDAARHFDAAATAAGFRTGAIAVSAAGPVESSASNRRVTMTNNRLRIDQAELTRKTRFTRALLLNDYEALVHAARRLPPRMTKRLRAGRGEPDGTILVVGPGTGLGSGIGATRDGQLVPLRSEGGASDFPLRTVEEYGLAAFITEEEGRAPGTPIDHEDLLSGRGLERLYRFLRTTEFLDKEVAPRLAAEEISATKERNPCSHAAFRLFERLLARRCKNLALDAWSTGGLFLAGGVVMRNHELFGERFLEEFSAHVNPRFRRMLERVPVTLIVDDDAGLLGAAAAMASQPRRRASRVSF